MSDSKKEKSVEEKIVAVTFGNAVTAMRKGSTVTRIGWEPDLFMFFVPRTTLKIKGNMITYGDRLDIKIANGSIVNWNPTIGEVLDSNWVILPD